MPPLQRPPRGEIALQGPMNGGSGSLYTVERDPEADRAAEEGVRVEGSDRL